MSESPQPKPPQSLHFSDDEGAVSISTLNRIRKSGRTRKGGVEFAAVAVRAPQAPTEDEKKEIKSEEQMAIDSWNQKFAVQGARMKEDLNRHM